MSTVNFVTRDRHMVLWDIVLFPDAFGPYKDWGFVYGLATTSGIFYTSRIARVTPDHSAYDYQGNRYTMWGVPVPQLKEPWDRLKAQFGVWGAIRQLIDMKRVASEY